MFVKHSLCTAHAKIRFHPSDGYVSLLSSTATSPNKRHQTTPRGFQHSLTADAPKKPAESGEVLELLLFNGMVHTANNCPCVCDGLLFLPAVGNDTFTLEEDWFDHLWSLTDLRSTPPFLPPPLSMLSLNQHIVQKCPNTSHRWKFLSQQATAESEYADRRGPSDPRLLFYADELHEELSYAFNSLVYEHSFKFPPIEANGSHSITADIKSNILDPTVGYFRTLGRSDASKSLISNSSELLKALFSTISGLHDNRQQWIDRMERITFYYQSAYPHTYQDQINAWKSPEERILSPHSCSESSSRLFDHFDFVDSLGLVPRDRNPPRFDSFPEWSNSQQASDNFHLLCTQAIMARSTLGLYPTQPQLIDLPAMCVGISGDSKAGKSTLINRLLSVPQEGGPPLSHVAIVPTGGDGSVSGALIELHHWPRMDYALIVHYLSTDAWRDIVTDAVSEVRSARQKKQTKEKFGSDVHKVARELSTYIQALTQSKLPVVFSPPQSWETDPFSLLRPYQIALLGTSPLERYTSPVDLRKRLRELSSVAMKPSLWPLVAKIDVIGPFPLLQQMGCSLLDMPGLTKDKDWFSNRQHEAYNKGIITSSFFMTSQSLSDSAPAALERHGADNSFGIIVPRRQEVAAKLVPDTQDEYAELFLDENPRFRTKLNQQKDLDLDRQLIASDALVEPYLHFVITRVLPDDLASIPFQFHCLENVDKEYISYQSKFDSLVKSLSDQRMSAIFKSSQQLIQPINIAIDTTDESLSKLRQLESLPESTSEADPFGLVLQTFLRGYTAPPMSCPAPLQDHYLQLQKLLRKPQSVAQHYRQAILPDIQVTRFGRLADLLFSGVQQSILMAISKILIAPISFNNVSSWAMSWFRSRSGEMSRQLLWLYDKVILDHSLVYPFPMPSNEKGCKKAMIAELQHWYELNATKVYQSLRDRLPELLSRLVKEYRERGLQSIRSLAIADIKGRRNNVSPLKLDAAENPPPYIHPQKKQLDLDFAGLPSHISSLLNLTDAYDPFFFDGPGTVVLQEIVLGFSQLNVIPSSSSSEASQAPSEASSSAQASSEASSSAAAPESFSLPSRTEQFAVSSVLFFSGVFSQVLFNFRRSGQHFSFILPFDIAHKVAVIIKNAMEKSPILLLH